jgi:large conductance mechanosensitive channel
LPTGDWRNAGVVLRAAADPKDNVVLKYGDFAGAVLDFFVVAFVIFLVVAKIGARIVKKKEEAPTTRECPFCIETIPIKAVKCKACASSLDDDLKTRASS